MMQQILLGMGGAAPIDASGGTKYTPGNGYVYHVFQYPNSDTFTVNSGSGDINYLLVAGGGAGGMGGSDAAGGGGAGQVLSLTSTNFGSGTYPVSVGQGGTKYTGPASATTHGGDTTFNSTTAGGGGMGSSGRWSPSLTPPGNSISARDGRSGTPGGSGSGGGGGGGGATGGTGSSPGGNPGGDGGMGSAGGGAGGAGQDDAPSPSGPFSQGGVGLAVPIYPGPLFSSMPSPWQSAVGPTGLFGGGGGATYPDGGTGTGGPGGGGNSAPGPDSSGSPGLNGTGGGGGGGGADRSDPQTNQPGGNGGHGICIIRYEAG